MRTSSIRFVFAALSLLGTSVFAPAAVAASDPFASAPTGIGTPETSGDAAANALASVDPSTGTLQATLAFDLPTARGAVQPGLSLTYDSSAGLREAGYRWGLSGVSQIERRHASGARGMPSGIDPPNAGADRFYFDGRPLVPICAAVSATADLGTSCSGERLPSWTSGWMYFRMEVEGEFARFFWNPDKTTWVVQRKSGETMELGAPLDSPGDRNGIDLDESGHYFEWNVVRRRDAGGRNSNRIVYAWNSSDLKGIHYLTDIYDTANEQGVFAHRTHLDYEFRTHAHADHSPRWHAVPQQKLTQVTVTSASMSSTSRELVRAYHLAYWETDRETLLIGFEMEGRCSTPIDENTALSGQTNCPRQPQTKIDYAALASSSVQTMSGPAPNPADKPVFVDVNSDGLPDILVPSKDPATPQALYLNSVTGVPGVFTKLDMRVSGPVNSDATSATFLSSNKATQAILGNFLGNGRLTALWHDGTWKGTGSLAFFAPADVGNNQWIWSGSSPTFNPLPTIPLVSFPDGWFPAFTEAPVFGDIDNDGIVDLVRPSGTANYLSTRDADGTIRPFSKMVPVPAVGVFDWGTGPYCDYGYNPDGDSAWVTHYPWPDGPEFTTSTSTQLADFDGDGVLDRVDVRELLAWQCQYVDTDVTVNCNGGEAKECKQWTPAAVGVVLDISAGLGDGTFSPALGTELRVSFPSRQTPGNVVVADVTGDGRADLFVATTHSVSLWVSEPDGFTRTTFAPVDNSFGETQIPGWNPNVCTLRAADMDGSGTNDIVTVCPNGVTYKTFESATDGHSIQDLRQISNGRGVTTEIEYASTGALAASSAPAKRFSIPQTMHMISKVTTRNHLPGAKEEIHSAEYTYSEPFYDGRTQSFRGFRDVVVNPVGSGASATSTHTRFLIGHCEEDVGHPCVQSVDRPGDALRGLPILVDTFVVGAWGGYSSTAHYSYRVDNLHTGMDGHVTRSVYRDQVDTFLYDTTPFTPSPSQTSALPEINFVNEASISKTVSVTLAAAATHLQTKHTIDNHGNETESWDLGQVEGQVDKPIHTVRHWTAYGADGWWWRPDTVQVDGAGAWVGSRSSATDYDDLGRPKAVRALLQGTAALARRHEDPSKKWAPPPSDASVDGWVQIATYSYDPTFGNVTRVEGPNGACNDVQFDPLFHQLRTGTTKYSGAGCGGTSLPTVTSFDRGLELATMSAGTNGAITLSTYDGFGRPLTIRRPSAVPHDTTTYQYDDILNGPVQRIKAQVSTAGAPVPGTSISTGGSGPVQTTWTYLDGFGHTVLTLTSADQAAGDGGDWVVSGLPDRNAMGQVVRTYQPSFFSGDPTAFPLGSSVSAAFRAVTYDAFGRVSQTYDLDGTTVSNVRYHALSRDEADERQMAFGLATHTHLDGHGRTTSVVRDLPNREALVLALGYYATGELSVVQQSHTPSSDPPVTRVMQYDSFGRMVVNTEPNTSSAAGTWTYAYNNSGNLVGTSDARGCGKNLAYDASGRVLAEDYSPCLNSQDPYTPPKANGDGTEVFNVYDAPEPGETADYGDPAQLIGQLVASYDRGSHTRFAYDLRGRVTGVARQIAEPDAHDDLLSRYAPHWYRVAAAYDDADRPIASTTGADVAALMPGGNSSVTTTYSARGLVSAIGGSYGALLARQTFDADGALIGQVFGDTANTASAFALDARRRVHVSTVGRFAPTTQWLLASDTFEYDAGTLKSITDGRNAAEWPTGAKPVNRVMTYDAIGQLKAVNYAYPSSDTFVPPLLAESHGDPSAYVPVRSDITTRVTQQSFDYDWMGNLTRSSDDVDAFWDRSIGTATMGGVTGPNRLMHSSSASGSLDVTYDASGNVTSINVTRSPDKCAERGICSNHFIYEWDEVGQLAHAQRFDFTVGAPTRVRVCVSQDPIPPGERPPGYKPPPPVCHFETTPGVPIAAPTDDADLWFVYDSNGARILKKVKHGGVLASVNAEIFPSLRLDHTTWNGTEYDRSATTETVYLAGGLGHVLYAPSGVPTNGGGPLHVLLEVGNHLGSTSIVVDKETSELVERVTYQAYGATESDYRSDRWESFRETYRLTGKEEDLDVGLTYFGARYYVAALGRWASADPLTIHGLGADLNPYAYVSGSPLSDIDPNGLDGLDDGAGSFSVPNDAWTAPVVTPGQPTINAAIGADVPSQGYLPGNVRGDEVNMSDFDGAPPVEDPSKLFQSSAQQAFDAITRGDVSFSGDDYGRHLWNEFISKGSYASVTSVTVVPIPSLTSAVADWLANSMKMSTAPTFNGAGTLNVSGIAASGTYLGVELAVSGGLASGGRAVTLFHGTETESALRFLNGADLDAAAAAARKIDGPSGFFLATNAEDAAYFAARRSGTVLQYTFSSTAVRQLGGLPASPLGPLGKFGQFAGGEVVVGTESFGLFNALRQSGHITVAPFHF